MKIGVFGTGVVAQIVSEKLQELGHSVMMGTRNIENTLAKTGNDNFGRPPYKEWQAQHPEIKLGTMQEAAAHGELLVNATSGGGTLQALELAGRRNLAGKTLLDIANPLDFSKGMPPTLTVCNTDSLGEQIQRSFPELHVVKGLNTLNAYLMVNPQLLPETTNLFIAGNNADAKDRVKQLLQSFGWAKQDVVDLGDITNARGTEQLLPIWVRLYGTLQNPMFNFKIVQGQVPA